MFSFPYKGFDILPDIVGFILAFTALRSLSEYSEGFETLKKYLYLLLPSSLVTLVLQILVLTGSKQNLFFEAYFTGYTALLAFYNILLLTAIKKIARETELKSLEARAMRNTVLAILYYAALLFSYLPFDFVKNVSSHPTYKVTLFLFGYIWQALNFVLIFSCYMWICRQGDEDMPVKKRRIGDTEDNADTQKILKHNNKEED